MEVLKRVGKAFAVGAAFGLIAQVLVLIFSGFIPGEIAVPVAMSVVGILAEVIILTGHYFKIAKTGGDGIVIAIPSLMFSGGMVAGGARAQGASRVKSYVKGFAAIMTVVATGYVICFILGLILK